MKKLIGSAAAKFAALTLGCVALCATTANAAGFDGKTLVTNDWFDVSFTSVAAGTVIATDSTTGITLGAGSWTAPANGDAEVLSDNTLSFDTDYGDELTLTPTTSPGTGMETVVLKVNANAVTTKPTVEDSPITAFALYKEDSTITPVAYVDGGWTNLVYDNAASLTNAWFTLYIDFANVDGTRSIRFSIGNTVLEDADGETWFPAASSATQISSLSFSGAGLCETISGDSIANAVAQVNGVNYATFDAAIAAAGDTYDIIVLDATATVPAGWKIADGKLVRKVYVAQVGETKYESLAEAVEAAASGATIELIADDDVSLTGGAEITIDKSLTITGAVDANGKPLYTIYGKPNQTGSNDIFITGAGTVMISNVKVEEFGCNAGTDAGHAPIYVSTRFAGTVNLDNVYISKFNRGGVFLYGGAFNVTDCYIDCANSRSGAFTKGIEIKGTATGTIADTVIVNMERSGSDSTAGIEIYGNGTVTVDGCTILSDVDTHESVKPTYGIVSSRVGVHDPSGGSLRVTDCVIDVSNAALSVADSDEYGPVNNYSIVVDGEETCFSNYIATWSAGSTITINEGEFSEDVYADAGTINITGGTFSNFAPDTNTGTIAISGGIFDADPSDYCIAGYAVTDNTDEATSEDYPYAVVPAVASITVDDATSYYATFEDAIDDAGLAEEEVTIVVINYNETMVAPEGWKFSTDVSVVPSVTTLVPTVSVEVTFELGEGYPTGATAPADGPYAVGEELPLPNYESETTSFAGWKVDGSDPEQVISVLPPDASGSVTLVATWIVVKSVEVTEGVSEAQTIKVTDEWLDANNIDKTDSAAIQTALNATSDNGLPAWQNYVLGQDPNAAVAADAAQGSVAAMPVVSTVQPQTVDTGFKVEYKLEALDASGNVIATSQAQDTPDLTVDLTELTSENKVAYYKTVAVITSTSDDNVTVTVESTNTVGVLRVASSAANTIIAVPWESLSGGSISVSNLVRTANLTQGDQLKAFDPATQKFMVWTLNAAKEWEPSITVTDTTSTAPAADTHTISRGSGVWLTRHNTTQPIYLVGGATSEAAQVEVKPGWNLVASTSTADGSVGEVAASNADRIVVPTDGLPKNYSYKDGAWGYDGKGETENIGGIVVASPERVTNDTAIPAGTGFWYVNQGESAKNVGL